MAHVNFNQRLIVTSYIASSKNSEELAHKLFEYRPYLPVRRSFLELKLDIKFVPIHRR